MAQIVVMGGGLNGLTAGMLQHFEGVSILTLPCDSGTWGVAFVASARDKELRALRAVPAWETALSLFPSVAHWGDAQAITGVQVIAGIEDRHRRHVVDGEPVVTGWPRSTPRSPASRISRATRPGTSARPCTRRRRATRTCCAPTPRWRR